MVKQMEPLFSLLEVERLCHVGRETLRKKVVSGEIASIRIGRQYRVPLSAIQKLLSGVDRRATAGRGGQILETEMLRPAQLETR